MVHAYGGPGMSILAWLGLVLQRRDDCQPHHELTGYEQNPLNYEVIRVLDTRTYNLCVLRLAYNA